MRVCKHSCDVLDSRLFYAWRVTWENSRKLCKPSTTSRVCITVSNSPNPSRVKMRLCKHRKSALLLKLCTVFENDILLLRSVLDDSTVNKYPSKYSNNHK